MNRSGEGGKVGRLTPLLQFDLAVIEPPGGRGDRHNKLQRCLKLDLAATRSCAAPRGIFN